MGYEKLSSNPVLHLSEVRHTCLDYMRFIFYMKIGQLIHAAAFGEASPLGSSIFADKVDDVSVEAAMEYRADNFVSGNLVVSGSGISQARLSEIVQTASFPQGARRVVKDSPFFGGETRQKADLKGAVHIALAFPAPIGESGSIILCLELGDCGSLAMMKLGKAFAVLKELLSAAGQTSFLHGYSSGALIGLYFTDAVQLQSAIQLLKTVAVSSPATLSGLDAVKTRASLSRLLSLEGGGAAEALVDAHVAGGGLSADKLADLRTVSAEAVVKAAQTVLSSSPAYAVLGDTKKAPSYSSVLSLLK